MQLNICSYFNGEALTTVKANSQFLRSKLITFCAPFATYKENGQRICSGLVEPYLEHALNFFVSIWVPSFLKNIRKNFGWMKFLKNIDYAIKNLLLSFNPAIAYVKVTHMWPLHILIFFFFLVIKGSTKSMQWAF